MDLPMPDADARAHSEALVMLIGERIREAGGWLGFADFMDLALYAPGLGYYSAGAAKLGAAGDFVTAPELSPVFSRCIAAQCAGVLRQVGGGMILEFGAGTGVMAADMLAELEVLGALPDRYAILELSADLRERQRAMLASRVPELVDRVDWLDRMPEGGVRGLIIANEVADALPVDRFVFRPGGIHAVGVAVGRGGLELSDGPASVALTDAVERVSGALTHGWPAGYESELCLRLPAWIAGIGAALEKGAVLVIDYGLPRREYYRAERSSGTLRCHYRHRAHEDPLFFPGLQDITAWVDFTAIAESAADAGLDVAGFTTQAQFLLAAGIETHLRAASDADAREQAQVAQAVRRLMLPGEMGEAVKVMTLTRGGPGLAEQAAAKDLRHSL